MSAADNLGNYRLPAVAVTSSATKLIETLRVDSVYSSIGLEL